MYWTWLQRLTLLTLFCPVSNYTRTLKWSFSLWDINFRELLFFACFQFVLCSSSNTCTDVLAQISSRFYQVHSFTVFPPSKVDFFGLKSGKNMTLTATKIKMLYQNQLPNQLPPESNLIKKESVAHNRVRTKVEKQKTLFTNGGGGESAQPVTAQVQFTSNGAHA